MSSGSSTPSMPSPDPGIATAANMSANVGNSWQNFAQNAYSTETGMQAGINNVTGTATGTAQNNATSAGEAANAAQADYQNNVVPVEDQYLNQAQNYDTASKESEAAATAKSDVESAATQQQGAMNRQLAAEGVNPASGNWQGEQRATGLGTAISEAGAENNARQQVKTTGLGLEANAVGLGNTDASIAATDSGLSTNSAATAANTTDAANSQFIAGTGIENTAYAGQEQGYANEGNLLQNQYNSELQSSEFSNQLEEQENASLYGGIGSIAGSLGSAAILASSKTFKNNKRPSKGNLDAMKKMPVGRWNYKKGIADGGAVEHIGPYAEDFNKATGLGDGKTIPMQDALGLTMGAVNELAGKLDQVHKAIGLNRPLPQPDIPKATKGGIGGKVRSASVEGTKPPKLKTPKLAQVKPVSRVYGLPQFRAIQRPTGKAA